MHATSVGSLFAVLMSLGYDWDTYDKFVIERPWHNVFKFSLYSVMNSFQNTGIFGIETIEDTLVPAMLGKDVAKDVTLQDFYELNGIALHFFTVDLATLELVNVSYKTHPTWTVIEAVYATSCAPVFFKPFGKDGVLYTDGGLVANYPIHQLFQDYPEIDPDTVLAINVNRKAQTSLKYSFGEQFTLYDYILELIFKIMEKMSGTIEKMKLKYEVFVDSSFVPALDMYSVVNSAEQRIKLIDYGVEAAKALDKG